MTEPEGKRRRTGSSRVCVFSKGCLSRALASSGMADRNHSHAPSQLGLLSGTAAGPSVERTLDGPEPLTEAPVIVLS
jgi:hypothetical protein